MEGFNHFEESIDDAERDFEQELELAFAGFPADPDTLPEDYSTTPITLMAPVVSTPSNQQATFPLNPYQIDPWQSQEHSGVMASSPPLWLNTGVSQHTVHFQAGNSHTAFDVPHNDTNRVDSPQSYNEASGTSSPLFVHSDNSSFHEAAQPSSSIDSPIDQDRFADPPRPPVTPARSSFPTSSNQRSLRHGMPNLNSKHSLHQKTATRPPDEQQMQMDSDSPTSPHARHYAPYHPYPRPPATPSPRERDDTHVSTKKHPEFSRINLLIYELRTKQLLDWEEIAYILNAQSHDEGSRKVFSVAAVYGRFSRNFSRIAPQYNDEELNKDDFVYLKRRRGGNPAELRTHLMRCRRDMQQSRGVHHEEHGGSNPLPHHPKRRDVQAPPCEGNTNDEDTMNDAEVDKVLKEVYEQIAPPFWSMVAQVVNLRCGTERGAEECAKRHGEL